MIVPVYVSHDTNPEKEIMVYALLDMQSDTTFVLDETVNELNAPATETTLRHTIMANIGIGVCSSRQSISAKKLKLNHNQNYGR
jgi:hypothetical protein